MPTCFWMLPQERPQGTILLSVAGQPPGELRTLFTVLHACLGDCGPASSSCQGPIPLEHYCLSPGLLEPGIQSELSHQGTKSREAGLSPPSFWGLHLYKHTPRLVWLPGFPAANAHVHCHVLRHLLWGLSFQDLLFLPLTMFCLAQSP